MGKLSRRTTAAGVALLALGVAGGAAAQDTVKIGAVYPLSGNAASAGNYEKMAIELAAEVVNNGNAELAKVLPFITATGGLPGLKGAKVQVVVDDNQGTPAAGANQTLRLITQEKVAAIIGAYQSGITETTSAIAEKYGTQLVNTESVAFRLTVPGLT
jgi:branched-chain amino acid transport system substrate-binding protein